MNYDDIIKAENLIQEIEQKINSGKKITIEESQYIGLKYDISGEEEKLKNPIFDYYNFHKTYIKYSFDLTFKGVYYKINRNNSLKNEFTKKLNQLNQKELNQKEFDSLIKYSIDKQILTPIEYNEIQKDKRYLEDLAKRWAEIILNEKHSDEEYKIISKETRDILKKNKIIQYLNNNLNKNESREIFKGLLKSYFIFNEAKKYLEKLKSNNEKTAYTLNGYSIELNLYSLIHILNRHYAKAISTNELILNKSFHLPNIEPDKINSFITNLIDLIKINGKESLIKVENEKPILINFNSINYAIFFGKYKYDNKKIILKTFFVIDETNSKSNYLIIKISNLTKHKLKDNLFIYL